MDDHRFDALVRALAGRASRRKLLRGAALIAASALAAVRGGGTVAYHGRIPLGGACRHTNQCLHHVSLRHRVRPNRQAVYCAYNGFRYDGNLNCCHNEGGSCQRDEHCCGDRHFCRRNVCTYLR
ncbi:MAG: hypothetical protein ACRDJC_08265 [Thermomicrobiales bacterium]